MNIDKYYDDINIAKLKIERILRKVKRKENENHRQPSEYSTAASVNGCPKRKFKLPKIELKKFSGKLIDWLGWWSQFEKIHTDKELHTTDKFEYLRQSMADNSKAKDVVYGFPATEANYPKAIQILKERFGKKKLLIQVYVRELFQMGLQNMNKNFEISSISDRLVSHVRSLESLGISMEQATLLLYLMMESSLPVDILVAWQRSSYYEKDGSAVNLN